MRSHLPGDVAVLADDAVELSATAQLLLDLARDLDRIAADDASIGQSADAIRDRTSDAARSLRTAEPRFSTTGSAVREFAVRLAELQGEHRRAITDVEDARTKVRYYDHELGELQRRKLLLMVSAPDPEEADELARRMAWLTREKAHAETLLAHAESRAIDAEYEWDLAARTAADRIRPVLDALNDSLLDKVGAALKDMGSFLLAVGEWVARILDTVLTGVLLAVMVVVALVVILTALAILIPTFLILLATGTSPDDLVEILIGIAIAVVPLLTPVVAALMLREAATPTPTVVPTKPLGGQLVQKEPAERYEYLFTNNNVIDKAGGDSSTVVEIVQVLNPDGTPALDENGKPIWRVTLPSTQDWQVPGGDHGAVNDLGSNLALILTPDMQAAYERAVTEAMRQAGIGPEDSVMLVGWSQGGILAGAIASNPDSGFTIRAIAVAGAPIDHMRIPDDVSVLAFQHDGDHVPRLDGVPPHQGANWVTVNTEAAGSGYPHDATKYAATAKHVTTGTVDPRVQHVMDEQSMFFSPAEIAYRYTFHEQDTSVI
ncbi:hypothetical protein [Protaetiibacter larvae]|uniref:Uncharacterized protein n=1 Tax=Protaetiibacter larvae TaxID=2592654 RepID=A0A5C1YBJ1_9MICO|nr:hypothetical protein [Protaetiibacter larvae]QEO10645.1 hypothetical protein FLP23_11900 [Protaetiibacter larvae]